MSYGTNGGVIGPDNVPTTSVASGVWSLGEIAEAVRDDIWPAPIYSQYEYIAGHTFDGSTSSYEFTGIPQTYNNLRIIGYTLAKASSIATPRLQVNGDTTSNYGMCWVGSHGGSLTGRFGGYISTSIYSYDTIEANTDTVHEILLDGYTLSSMVSPLQFQFGTCAASTGDMSANGTSGVLLNGTAAITSLKYYDATDYKFASGSII